MLPPLTPDQLADATGDYGAVGRAMPAAQAPALAVPVAPKVATLGGARDFQPVKGATMPKVKTVQRTTHGLRDILFDEIDALRSPEADPRRAVAVARLAQQIIGTAKVELDFHRTLANLSEKGAPVSLGTLALGSN